jgi:putative serine protease PepD
MVDTITYSPLGSSVEQLADELVAAVERTLSQTGADSSPARSAVNLPISSVEEVAAKVLPSVVTLQSEVGGQSYLGSGIILTPAALIMTNKPCRGGHGQSAL